MADTETPPSDEKVDKTATREQLASGLREALSPQTEPAPASTAVEPLPAATVEPTQVDAPPPVDAPRTEVPDYEKESKELKAELTRVKSEQQRIQIEQQIKQVGQEEQNFFMDTDRKVKRQDALIADLNSDAQEAARENDLEALQRIQSRIQSVQAARQDIIEAYQWAKNSRDTYSKNDQLNRQLSALDSEIKKYGISLDDLKEGGVKNPYDPYEVLNVSLAVSEKKLTESIAKKYEDKIAKLEAEAKEAKEKWKLSSPGSVADGQTSGTGSKSTSYKTGGSLSQIAAGLKQAGITKR